MTENATVPFPVRLHALHWGGGDPEAPRALLLHGLTSSAGTWWQVASALASAGWSVTAPDLRGHGASPRTPQYPLADYAGDVARLVPEGGGAWDLVVGHSLGGAIAVVTAGAHPEWAAALLLVDPVLSLPEEARESVLAELLGDLEQLDARALQQAHPKWHTEDAVQKVNAARVVSPFVVERTVHDNRDWALEPLVEHAATRIHVLGADPAQGASFSPTQGARLTGANPGLVTSAVVEGAGHSIQRDDPRRVIAEALALVGGAPARVG